MNITLIAILCILLPFILTTIGSIFVYFLKSNFNNKISSIVMGFAGGIMIAASVWSMIIPSFEYSARLNNWSFLPAVIGIVLGCVFVILTDLFLKKSNSANLFKDKKLTRFLVAFTVHNIPEGLAVGFAVGSALTSGSQVAIAGAIALSIGIAIQNLPEGMAVSLPVFKSTGKKTKSFITGVLSGIVEPVFALLGLLLATKISVLMPWLLCFSAGCMIFVTAEDILPECKLESSHLGTWGFVFGFLIMMTLDVALG